MWKFVRKNGKFLWKIEGKFEFETPKGRNLRFHLRSSRFSHKNQHFPTRRSSLITSAPNKRLKKRPEKFLNSTHLYPTILSSICEDKKETFFFVAIKFSYIAVFSEHKLCVCLLKSLEIKTEIILMLCFLRIILI